MAPVTTASTSKATRPLTEIVADDPALSTALHEALGAYEAQRDPDEQMMDADEWVDKHRRFTHAAEDFFIALYVAVNR